MPFSSLRARNSEAQRCGHLWSMTPMRPALSRNAISCSPSSISRIGSPLAFSSDDIAAGSQYCRIRLPIVVPGPTRTRSSLSFCRMVWLPVSLCPECETKTGAGPGGRAIARLVKRPFEREMLDRAGDADPVSDLGAAGVQQLARQVLDRLAVAALQHVEKAAVERFVDDKMRQPARRDDADALVARVTLDRGADRLAELVTAARSRLVGRVVGVDADRHDRHHLLHDPPVDKADRMPLALALGTSSGGGEVEFVVDQPVDQMAGEPGIDR